MKKKISLLAFLAILLFGHSQDSPNTNKVSFKSKVLNTDRGTFTRSASNIAKGLQVELGINYTWIDSDNSTYKNDLFNPLKAKLRLGLNSKVELNFAISNNQMIVRTWDESSKDKYNYWSPLDIGIRAQFIDSKKKCNTDAAFYIGLGVISTQRSAFEENGNPRPWVLVNRPGYVTPEFGLFVDHNLGSRLELAYNFGVKWTGLVLDDAASAKNPDVFYTLRATAHATNTLDFYLEHYNYLRKAYYSNLGLNLGARYAVTKKFEIGVNAGVGLNSASPDGFAGGGLSYKLGK